MWGDAAESGRRAMDEACGMGKRDTMARIYQAFLGLQAGGDDFSPVSAVIDSSASSALALPAAPVAWLQQPVASGGALVSSSSSPRDPGTETAALLALPDSTADGAVTMPDRRALWEGMVHASESGGTPMKRRQAAPCAARFIDWRARVALPPTSGSADPVGGIAQWRDPRHNS